MPVVAGSYPAARTGRLGGTPAFQATATAARLPRTRFINFDLNSTPADRRTTISTPRLQGPVLIRAGRITTDGSAAPPSTAIELGYARVPAVEQDVTLTSAKPYTTLMERINDAAPNATAPPPGIIHGSSGAGGPNFGEFALGLIVDEPEVYITISITSTTFASPNVWGYLVIVEGLSRAALANFL